MKKLYLLIISILCSTYLFFTTACTPVQEVRALKGKLDLSSRDFKETGPVKLDGEWEFFWNRILYHNDPFLESPHENPVYQKVPALWNTYTLDDRTLPDSGYATFKLLITLPDTDKIYGIKVIDMSTAYSLYVNGKFIMGNGNVGRNKEESVPRWQACIGLFKPESEKAEIIIHVSNFHYDKSGFWKSITFGPENQITSLNIRSISWNFFILGIYLAIGLYHLVLFFLGRNDKATLFFGIFCLISTIRTAFTDERIALLLFPRINWHFSLLLEFLSIYGLVIFFILFISALYPKEMLSFFNRTIIAVNICMSVLIVFLPTNMINSIHSYYLLFLLINILYIFIVLILATIKNRTGALFLFIGFFLFSITVLYDVLAAMIIINTIFISPIGLVFFILSEFALYIKFIKAEEELREREKELLQAEKLASLGTLIAGVAHEINNPNSSIYLTTRTLSSIWDSLDPKLDDYVLHEGDFNVGNSYYSEIKGEIPDSLKRIIRNSERIKQIVKDLKDYAKRDENSLDQEVNITEVIQSAIRLLENCIKKNTSTCELELSENLPLVQGNAQRLEQVIINIIQNACQATRNRGKGIRIHTRYDEEKKKIFITVQDEGVGMDKKTLKQIYDPFFTTRRANGGTGLGLSVSLRIINNHNGTLLITSKPGKGTVVVIGLNVTENSRMNINKNLND